MTGMHNAVFAGAIVAIGCASAARAGEPAPTPARAAAIQQTDTVEAVLIEGNDLIAADA